MSDQCSNECANSRELRKMIDQVAEKAAKDAAENVSRQLHMDMLEMEHRLEKQLLKEFDSKLKEYFGMTPQEHAIEHDRMKKMYGAWEGISSAFWKKITLGILLAALGTAGFNIANSKTLKPAILNKPAIQEERRVDDEANR